MASFLDFASEYSDGWSLVAVRAPLEAVSDSLTGDPDVTGRHPRAAARVMRRDPATGLSHDDQGRLLSLSPAPHERICFLVQSRGSDWSILYRTLGWAGSTDACWTEECARRLSAGLDCAAVSSCGGGHGLLFARYEAGELTARVDGYNRKKVAKQLAVLGGPGAGTPDGVHRRRSARALPLRGLGRQHRALRPLPDPGGVRRRPQAGCGWGSALYFAVGTGWRFLGTRSGTR